MQRGRLAVAGVPHLGAGIQQQAGDVEALLGRSIAQAGLLERCVDLAGLSVN